MLEGLPRDGLTRATIARVVYLVLQGGSSVVVFALLARVLDPDELGAVSTAFAIYAVAQVIGDLGLSQLTTIEVPRALSESRVRGDAVAARVARLFLVGAAMAAALTAALSLICPPDTRLAVLALAPASASALLVSAGESLRRSYGDFWSPVLFVASSRLPFFAVIPLLGPNPTAAAAAAAFSGATFAGSIPAIRLVLRSARKHRVATTTTASTVLQTTLAIGIVGMLIVLATRLNVVVLALVATLEAVGEFEAAWRAFQPLVYAAGALGTAATPFTAAAAWSGARIRPIVESGLIGAAGIGLFGAALLLIFADPIAVVVYGMGDSSVVGSVRVLAVAAPITTVSYYAQTAVLLPLRHFRILVVATACMAVATLGLTALLGHGHGATGCAAAVLAGQAIYGACVGAGLALIRYRMR
jgi:O-antigen/teichoic acid export membrane protein